MLVTLIAAIYITIILLFSLSAINSSLLAQDIALWAGVGIIYLLYFHKSLPRRIIINDNNIIIYEYISQKRTIIKYTDIDTIRTFDQFTDSRNTNTSSIRILQIELYNEKIYRISENDFVNYDFLANAIYRNFSEKHNKSLHLD